MNIVYVANIRFPTEKAHGAAIAKACEALVRAGEEVTLLTPARNTPISVPALQYYGIKTSFIIRRLACIDVVSFGKLGFWVQSLTFASSVLAHLKSSAHDVVYGRDELVLAMLALCGIKNIYWESHDGTWNIASRYVAKHAKGIVVVSKGLKDFYIHKGVPAEKILAVPNAIDIVAFAHPETKEEARGRLNLPQDKTIALYIGRLDGWKGTDTLLEASKLLPDILVALIGGEPQQVEKLKTQYPNVTFLGYRPYTELSDNQAAADVLVVPNTAKDKVSVRFTSPLKLIAHMASHRPIVAADLPSIRELVDDTSAVLVEPDNAEALAAGIQKALISPYIAGKAYLRALELDWPTRAQKILEFIRRLL
ncbi:glycosyltransferase family 4 protein [Patescibacteria group bacterium]|nr:glycosyltransferase family 4 protein [Patescibacteria group bacterium]